MPACTDLFGRVCNCKSAAVVSTVITTTTAVTAAAITMEPFGSRAGVLYPMKTHALHG